MHLGRVMGTVVATTKAEGLDGVKFLIVQPLDKHERDTGIPVVAADGRLLGLVARRDVLRGVRSLMDRRGIRGLDGPRTPGLFLSATGTPARTPSTSARTSVR